MESMPAIARTTNQIAQKSTTISNNNPISRNKRTPSVNNYSKLKMSKLVRRK